MIFNKLRTKYLRFLEFEKVYRKKKRSRFVSF